MKALSVALFLINCTLTAWNVAAGSYGWAAISYGAAMLNAYTFYIQTRYEI